MELYIHKNRNVVVKRDEPTEDGKALVSFVVLADTVVGQARRGRKPNYDVAVSASDLVAVESPSDELLALATKALTAMPAASEEVVAETETAEVESTDSASFDPNAPVTA